MEYSMSQAVVGEQLKAAACLGRSCSLEMHYVYMYANGRCSDQGLGSLAECDIQAVGRARLHGGL